MFLKQILLGEISINLYQQILFSNQNLNLRRKRNLDSLYNDKISLRSLENGLSARQNWLCNLSSETSFWKADDDMLKLRRHSMKICFYPICRTLRQHLTKLMILIVPFRKRTLGEVNVGVFQVLQRKKVVGREIEGPYLLFPQ